MVTSAAYLIPYQQLAQMAKPAYAGVGELIDGGFDMSTGGVCGYVFSLFMFICFYFFVIFYLFPLPNLTEIGIEIKRMLGS